MQCIKKGALLKNKCNVCGGTIKKIGSKSCGKSRCKNLARLAPRGRIAMDEYEPFKKKLVNGDYDAVQLARQEKIEQMYCAKENKLWLDEGVKLDLSLCKSLGYPDIYKGVRGKLEQPYTDNEGITDITTEVN
jgi:hypothetical protein